ncbi:MAG: dephospho-CoA kinase, partial [Parvicellaceae bacterium]
DEWADQQSSEILIKEAAILIESGAYKQCDKILVVTCPEETRIERVMKRDEVIREQVTVRIAKQISEEERLSYADFTIDNSGASMLIPQVEEVVRKLTI